MTVTTTPSGTIDITSMMEDYRPGESRVGLVIGLTVTFCTLAIILASARIYVRYWLLNAFGKDDCCLLGALAMTLANGALGLWATQTVGLGRHVVDIVKYGPPLNLDTLHLFRLLGPSFYHLSQLLIQLSILVFYLRLSFSQRVERFIYVLMLCSSLNATSGFLINLISGLVRGRGSSPPQNNIRVLWYSNSGISLFIDLAILCLPLSSVWKLRHMNIRKKLGIIATLSVGLLSCISVIIRLCYVERASRFDNGDSPWDFVTIYIMGLVEASCGVCGASMATLRPLLARWGVMLSVAGSKQILKDSESAVRQGPPAGREQVNHNLGSDGMVKRKMTPSEIASPGLKDLIYTGSRGTENMLVSCMVTHDGQCTEGYCKQVKQCTSKPDARDDIEMQYMERFVGESMTEIEETARAPDHTRRQCNSGTGEGNPLRKGSLGDVSVDMRYCKENELAGPKSESMASLAKRRDPEEHGATT